MITQFTVGDYHEERGTYTISYFSEAINENSWIEVFPEYNIEDILLAIAFNEMSYSEDEPGGYLSGQEEFETKMLEKAVKKFS